MPKVDATKCPKLDRVVKGSDTKDADNTLAKLQTLMLDAVAPLVHIVETAQSGNLTIDTSVKEAKLPIRLLANASAHVSKERRKTALKDLNKDLLTLVEDDERFGEVAPMDGFEKTMWRRCSNNKNESFFRKGRPQGQYHHYRGGGNNHRGRGRYHPYRGTNFSQSAGREKKNQPHQ